MTQSNRSRSSNSNIEKNRHQLETFNLTHDNSNGFRLEFDDTNWSKNMNVLKPLGLSILLNTCNEELTKSYARLYDFIRLESIRLISLNECQLEKSSYAYINSINLNNLNNSFSSGLSIVDENFEIKVPCERRCLCQIPKIIGFDERSAIKSYKIVNSNSIYRNLEIKPTSKMKPKQILMSDLFSIVANCKLNGFNNLY